MQDRTPTPGQDGRVKITPEDGSTPFYAKVEMADNPTEPGTPYNKQAVLQDITCELLGLPPTSVPNDAFFRLALPSDRYAAKVTVLSPGGIPLPGITVNGLETLGGGTVVTGSDGTALGLSSQANVTLTAVNPYLDFSGNATAQFTLEHDVINQCTLKFTRSSTTSKTFSSSQMVRLSPDVGTFNCSAIGGGRNGSPGRSEYDNTAPAPYYVSATGGRGGNAGAIANKENIPNPGEPISVVVGAVNGNSSIGSYITALGGSGAVGGSGGYFWSDMTPGSQDTTSRAATPGGNSSGFLFPTTDVGGAGGGGACYVYNEHTAGSESFGEGGNPGGGNGGTYHPGRQPGAPGSLPGSGGGGGTGYNYNGSDLSTEGGAGSAGLCGMTWSFINEVAA